MDKIDRPFPSTKKTSTTTRHPSMQRYTPPKPAPLPEDFDEFWASLTEPEKQLHALAVEKLGTSYFIQWTRMYTKWSEAKAKAKASASASASAT